MSRYWQDDYRSHYRRRSDYRSSHHNGRSRPSDEYYREPLDDYSSRSMFSSSTSGNGYLEPQPSTSHSENVSDNEEVINAIKYLEEENSNSEFVEYKHETEVHGWYKAQLNTKVEEAKQKLQYLSSSVCCDEKCEEYIRRMEADHKTPLCRMDPARHPSYSSFWNNSWKFNCTARCRVHDDPYHVHSNECQSFIMEEQDTKASIYDNNNPQEFPTFIMDVVKAFQDFVNDKSYYSHNSKKPSWQWIKLKCNCEREIMMTVCGSDLGSLTQELRNYFERGPGSDMNVQTIYMGFKKPNAKNNQVKEFCKLYGKPFIRDKVGPISILYNAKTNTHFNSIALFELGRLINEYLQPGKSTVVVEIGCSVGVLSLMLASHCKQVIGISNLKSDLEAAETIANQNDIENCLFPYLDETQIQKLQPYVRESQSMAVLWVNSVYGNHKKVYEQLRDFPTLCKLVLYGTFNDQHQIGHFYGRIKDKFTRLTNYYDDDKPFMPKQTCIIDKSPTSKNLYDFVILMERKSIIQPDDEFMFKIKETHSHKKKNENANLPISVDAYSNSNKRKPDDSFESEYQLLTKRKNCNGYSGEMSSLVTKTDNGTSDIIIPDVTNVDLNMPDKPVSLDLMDHHGKSKYENMNTGNLSQQRIPVSDPILQTHSLLTGVTEKSLAVINQMKINVHQTTDHLKNNIERIRLSNEMRQRVSHERAHEDRDPRVKSRHVNQKSLEDNSNERRNISETIVKPTQSTIDLEYSAVYKEKMEAKKNRQSFKGLQIKEEKDLEDTNEDYGKRESRNKDDRDKMEKYSENRKSEGKHIKENEASDRKNNEIREKSKTREKHGKYKREESKRDMKKENCKVDKKITSRSKDENRDKDRERDESKHKKKSKETKKDNCSYYGNSKEKIKKKHKEESKKKLEVREKESQMAGSKSVENKSNERKSNKTDESKKNSKEKGRLSKKDSERDSSIKTDVPIPAVSSESGFILGKQVKKEPNSNSADPILNVMRENPLMHTIKLETLIETEFSEVKILPMKRSQPIIIDVLSDDDNDEKNIEFTTRPQQIKVEDVPVPPIPETVFALDKQIKKESNLNNADSLNVMRENRPPLNSTNVQLGETPSIQTPMNIDFNGVNNDEQHIELQQIKIEDVPVPSVIEPMPTINIADPRNIKRENMIPMDEANVKSELDFTPMNVDCGEVRFGQNQALVKTDESTVDNDIFTMATPRITPAALLNHHSATLPEQSRANFSKIDGFNVVTTGSYVGMSINNIMSESSNQGFEATDMNHQVFMENTTHEIKSEVVENNDTLNTADNLTAIEETVQTEDAVISDIKPEPTEETSENDFASFQSQGTLKVRKLNDLLASPAPNQLEKDQ